MRRSRDAEGREARPYEIVVARDVRWGGELRSALLYPAGLLALLELTDWGSGGLDAWRAALWAALAALLCLVLLPPRIVAGDGWLTTRWLLWRRHVRTDRLVAVRSVGGVAERLLLRDELGGWAEIEPHVLVANPALWKCVDEGARASLAHGSMLCGAPVLHMVRRRIDLETARTVFRVSGLE